jgi:hypothetical protein
MKLVLITFCLVGCICLSSCHSSKGPEFDEAIRVIKEHGKDVAKTRSMQMESIGWLVVDKIEKLITSFDVLQIVTLEEARIRMVEETENFLKKINTDEKVRPYLLEHPFTIKHIQFALSFPRKPWGAEYVIYVSKRDGDVHYYINANKDGHKLQHIHSEPYPEAKRIVEESKAAAIATQIPA